MKQKLCFKIACQIVAQKADYLLSVKLNQSDLYDELTLAFEAHDAEMAPFRVFERESVDKDHGRIERRIYSVIWDEEYLLAALGASLPAGRSRDCPEESCAGTCHLRG